MRGTRRRRGALLTWALLQELGTDFQDLHRQVAEGLLDYLAFLRTLFFEAVEVGLDLRLLLMPLIHEVVELQEFRLDVLHFIPKDRVDQGLQDWILLGAHDEARDRVLGVELPLYAVQYTTLGLRDLGLGVLHDEGLRLLHAFQDIRLDADEILVDGGVVHLQLLEGVIVLDKALVHLHDGVPDASHGLPVGLVLSLKLFDLVVLLRRVHVPGVSGRRDPAVLQAWSLQRDAMGASGYD